MAYTIDEAKKDVIRAGKELLESGLIARTWGNISARVSATQFVITPSGKAYDSLTPDDIVLVDMEDGQPIAEEGKPYVKPSSEKGIHVAAYHLRPDVNFIIHTHQNYATALSTLGRQFHLKNINQKVKDTIGPFIPTAKYGLSGTNKLKKNVEFSIKKYPQAKTVLMRNHGVLCMGKDYDDTFKIAHTLEKVSLMKYRQIVGDLFPTEALEGKPLMEYATVLHKDIHEEYDRHYLAFENDKTGCILESQAPFMMKMSSIGKDMRIFIDDMAQMVGTKIVCLTQDASEKKIAAALSGACSAVLMEGKGAICSAGSEEDAEAVMMVLDKECRAQLIDYALHHGGDKRRGKPVSLVHGVLEHVFYIKKYSKLKDVEEETC